MKNNKLKLIWNIGANEEIKSYSEPELNKMIIVCARKSIRKIYPGWVLRTIVVLVVSLLLFQITMGNGNLSITIFRCILLFILVASLAGMEWAARKMDKYDFDMSVKEWLKYRIDKINKSIRFKRKYDIAIYGGSFILGLGTFIMYNYLMNKLFNPLIFIVVSFVFLLYILGCRMMVRKHDQKVLRQLQELYNKLEE